MTDHPIEEQGFLYGVNVVDIGDLRIARGLTRRPITSCQHRALNYDPKERRVWCKHCESDVEAFDAFTILVEHFDGAWKQHQKRAQELAEAEKFQVRSIAAKVIDQAWRSKNMVPACPHCSNGLFPEDFKSTPAMLGKDFARAKLGKGNP